ncbi:metallophosphoesterase family protein [Candidatus Woesearchaeota archaeon]|nr:metallophosphoesterase family protein [Candidatus Woesearchaeota archaeon]
MKLLLFVDVHGDVSALARLKQLSNKVDLVVCAGDISQMEHNLSELLNELNEFHVPVLIIHGNHEDAEGLKEACSVFKNLIFLHKGAHHFYKYVFLGYGGGGFAQTDQEFKQVAEKFFLNELKGKEKVILIVHAPPYKTKLDKIGGEYRGNKSVREFIDNVQPTLVVCGHLHENAGKEDKLGKTFIINPGKKGVIVDV